MNINKIRVPKKYDRRFNNISKNDIMEMIRQKTSFNISYKEIGKSFGVSAMFVCRLCNKEVADRTRKDNNARRKKNYVFSIEVSEKRKEYKEYKKRLLTDLGIWKAKEDLK